MSKMRVEIEMTVARRIIAYDDSVPLSSEEIIFPNDETARAVLRKMQEPEDEIDVLEGGYGWMLEHHTMSFDSSETPEEIRNNLARTQEIREYGYNIWVPFDRE